MDLGFDICMTKNTFCSTVAEMEHMCQVRGHMGYALFGPAGPVAL